MTLLLQALGKKIKTGHLLQSLIKTMKMLAAINALSYQKAAQGLMNYYRSLELGILACLQQSTQLVESIERKKVVIRKTGAILFGSDQGMVGDFNDRIVDFALRELQHISGQKIVWSVGDRVHSRLKNERNLELKNSFHALASIENLLDLMTQLLDQIEKESDLDQLYVFYNQSKSHTVFESHFQLLVPIDKNWLNQFFYKKTWPTQMIPEIVDNIEDTFTTLIGEYLFAGICKACITSLACENEVRLASMQTAEQDIEDFLEALQQQFNLERQNTIDKELFDVLAGFALINRPFA